MKKKQTKRLELSKETVAILEQGDLVKVAGGYSNYNGGFASCNRLTDECCQQV